MILPLLAGGAAAYGGYKALQSLLGSGKKSETPQILSSPETGNFLTGYGSQLQQLPRVTPQQMNIQQQLGNTALSSLQAPADFAPIEDLARKRFQEQTVPGLATRLTSFGAPLSSSGFQSSISGAGADLEAQLAALRSQHGLAQRGQALQQAGLALQPTYENIYIPGTSGLLGAAAPGIAQYGLQAALANPEATTSALGSLGAGIGTAASGLAVPALAGAGAGASLAGLIALYNYLQQGKGQQLGGK